MMESMHTVVREMVLHTTGQATCCDSKLPTIILPNTAVVGPQLRTCSKQTGSLAQKPQPLRRSLAPSAGCPLRQWL